MTAITDLTMPFVPARPARPLHDPRFEMRVGVALLALFGVGFVGWAAIARLDSAVHAPGVIRVDGNRQAVQSQAGGIVTGINVHEGDHVRAGQVLVNFGTVEAMAQARSLASRVIGLQAEIARIDAENSGAATVAEPVEWATLDPDERAMARSALAGEQANMAAQRALIASQRSVLRERLAQTGSQISGYEKRRSANRQQSAINVDELDGVNALYRKGYATKTRVLALERDAASIQGEVGAIDAEIARLGAVRGETQLQILQLSDQREQTNSDRLRQAQTELQTVLPQWKAAREALAQAQARAPISGTVLGLAVNSIGGVAPRGGKLMDIVPDHAALEIETQIAPNDANDLKPGQKADIHIGSLRGRTLPVLHGIVSRVSADSITDEKTGRAFFTATVTVPAATLREVTREAGVDGTLRPGTPVDVTVPLRARTALEYWLEPLFRRFRPAMTEQ